MGNRNPRGLTAEEMQAALREAWEASRQSAPEIKRPSSLMAAIEAKERAEAAKERFRGNIAREVVLKGRSVESVAREYGLSRANVAQWAEERRERLMEEARAAYSLDVLRGIRETPVSPEEHPTEEEKRRAVQECLESEITVREFAGKHGIDLQTACEWIGKYGGK